ncbi:MAG: alpha/beta fold hydrolase [Gemmatimonadaceae bacterium]
MSQSYRPARWLSNPHLVTMWGKFFQSARVVPASTERWSTPDDDFVDVVRIPATHEEAPTFLLLHGLEGNARSHYATGTLLAAAARGWQANLLVFRSCGDEMNRAMRSYHSGETTDIDLVVRRLLNERPYAPLVLGGVSLGGNVLLKWLGEQGSAIDQRVRAATAVSVPFDLARSCAHMERGFARVYGWNFLKTLKRKALEKLERHPNIADRDRILSARTLWEFDDAFTSIVHGFRDAADYYAQSSSMRFLSTIRVPTLLLSSRDDPFHPPSVLDQVAQIAAGNPSLTLEFTDRGGHVGFLEGAHPLRTANYSERRIVDFGASVLQRTGAVISA